MLVIVVLHVLGSLVACSEEIPSTNEAYIRPTLSPSPDWLVRWLSEPVCQPPCWENITRGKTSFTMDLNTGLTQALSDGTNAYIYGLDRIAQTQGNATEYFLDDALGSARQLTNQSASITYARAYDPYSAATTTSGASQSAYGYTGEYASNDLVYLRARYYASNTGRFLTRDVLGGIFSDPITFNRWAYVRDNPVLLTDPSGHCDILCIIAILIALGVITTGCSDSTLSPEPDACPPLPDNLQPAALRDNPRQQTLSNIQSRFSIQLPPSVTYVDQNGGSHSTSHHFVYSAIDTVNPFNGEAAGGFTPWFGVKAN